MTLCVLLVLGKRRSPFRTLRDIKIVIHRIEYIDEIQIRREVERWM